MKLKSIRTKLGMLLFSTALIPLLLVIFFYLSSNISHSIDNTKSDGMLRNSIVNEHLTELFERNFAVLCTVARNPMTLHYIQAAPEERGKSTEQTLRQANAVLKDENNMIITDSSAQQLVRSDNYPLVNVSHRRYFQDCVRGIECISDVLISLANNRLITVIAEPVCDENGNPVGIIQRDYDLAALQKFVQQLDSPYARVLITDSVGNIVAHSGRPNADNRLMGMSDHPAVAAALAGKTGSISVSVKNPEGKKERVLASYSRNELSGWVIVTEGPFRLIWKPVVAEATTAAVLGIILLLAIALVASFLSEKATAKLRAVSSLANRAAAGSIDPVSLSELGDDELGQMAMAINKIRSSRDSYRKDAEVDKLTGLLNKATFERLCRRQLAGNMAGVFSALLIIDLDHFKEVNDTFGHQTGDAVLHDFAEVLRRLFRPSDFVGRFGGDEFVVFLNDIPGKEIALQKAQRILDAASHVLLGVGGTKVSASVGIAASPQHGADYDSLFSMADRSVYNVKEGGRNGICFGKEEIQRLS